MARSTTRLALIIAAMAASTLAGCVPMVDLDDARPRGPSHRYPVIDGIRFHVEISGQGDPVVLLHGFGGSTYSWRAVAPVLAEHYRVVNVDLLGFGYSDRPENPEAFRRDAQIARLSKLVASLGIERADWLGHSYGGGLALALAAEYPGRVRSLVLIDAVGPNHSIERKRAAARAAPLSFAYVRGLGLRRRFIERVLKKTVFDPETITDEVIDEYRDRLRIRGAVRSFRYLSSGPVGERERKIALGEVLAPALVVWGAHDPLMGVDIGHEGAAELTAAEPLVVIAEAGHSPMEEKPEEVLPHLLAFLEKQ